MDRCNRLETKEGHILKQSPFSGLALTKSIKLQGHKHHTDLQVNLQVDVHNPTKGNACVWQRTEVII
jgi:hypothetical protein